VRTGADSAARLVMIDSTNLSLGPSATLTLDRTVFNDEHSYREISIRLASGAFRFVTGHSDKNAYKISTGLATIGVRGTELHILSQPARSTVVLGDAPGAALVCTLTRQCTSLTVPGDTAIINLFNGQTTIQKTNNPPWTFAQTCGAAAGLCSTTQFADATPPGDDGSDPTGMLCGR
jgi:FecR-like protein